MSTFTDTRTNLQGGLKASGCCVPGSAERFCQQDNCCNPLHNLFTPSPLLPPFLPSSRTNLDLISSKNVGSSHRPPQWRSLPLVQEHIPTGLTQGTDPEFHQFGGCDAGLEAGGGEEEGASFLSAADLSFISGSDVEDVSAREEEEADEEETVLSRYYEHSFAVHEDISSSAAASQSSSSSLNDSTVYDSFAFPNADDVRQDRLLSTPVTDLKDIPSAAYLHSINPQTMTVNVLIGIIAIPPARTIITRKDKREVQLVEMIVGDETKAGFGVN
ncbi:MAG: hypothetical protein Q9222_007939, partial [Ikaeria aurantiellina]